MFTSVKVRGGAVRTRTRCPLVAITPVLAFLACSPPASTPETSDTALTVGIPSQPNRPGLGVLQLASIFTEEGLTKTDSNGRPIGILASEWSVDRNGQELIVELRPDVTFHDGRGLTAEIVRASLERSRSDSNVVARYPSLADIESIDVLAQHRLRIRLRQPSSLLLDDLEVPITTLSPSGEPVGTGPLILERAEVDEVMFRSHRKYHGGEIAIDRVLFKAFPSLRSAWAALLRGEIDAIHEMPIESREFIEQESDVRVYSYTRPYVFVLAFDLLGASPFRSRELRLALNHAIDRDDIINTVFRGYARPAATIISPSHWTVQGPGEPFEYNPELAERKLTAAGYTPPQSGDDTKSARFRFHCLVPAGRSHTEERLALVIQRQLWQIGVEMVIVPATIEEFARRIEERRYEAALFDLSAGPGLVQWYIYWHSGNRGPWNFGHGSADVALDALRDAVTQAELESAAEEIRTLFHKDPPAVFIAWANTARVVSRRFEVPYEPGEDVIRSLWRWRPVDRPSARAANR